MNKLPSNNHSHLWNDLPDEERARLMPYAIETQILHVWQCKQTALAAHHNTMREFDEWIKSLESELKRLT